MTEKELVATTPLGKYMDTSTSYVGTYVIDRIKSTASTMVSELEILMRNCGVLSKKESFTLSQHDQEHIEESINKLQKAVKLFGDGINDWKFTNDMRALILSVDDLAQMVLTAASNTRYVAQDYNWRKYVFILRDMGVSEDIIKTIDDARTKHILKSGRRKSEHQDPFSQTRKWLKKRLLGFRFFINCQCGRVHDVRDYDIIQYVEPNKNTRHLETEAIPEVRTTPKCYRCDKDGTNYFFGGYAYCNTHFKDWLEVETSRKDLQ